MHVVVLGAGVAGVTSAWYLAKAGHEVTVIDRQPAAALETSFANGGQISVSHAEPWADPSVPFKVLKWLGREDAPLLFRLRADLAQWRWCLRFLRECTAARTLANTRNLVKLGLYSRARLRALRAETGIEYDHLTRGILHFFTDERELDAARGHAHVMHELGCELEFKSVDECVAIEPALNDARSKIVGGSMTPSDESGDAHLFTQRLAALAEKRGVRFAFGYTIEAIVRDGDRIAGIRARQAQRGASAIEGDAFVVSLGSYSPLMLAPLGISLAVYPGKGYSVTMPVVDSARAYQVSLSDDEYKLVFSRLGERLRIAGTLELTGYDTTLNDIRCRAILNRTMALFPGAGDAHAAQFWTGLRPITPSNVPYIGKTKYKNLYLNTGHGTLGFTHACGSGSATADIVSGKRPEVDFAFVGMA
jgi:D-amino-acid dehydrogenase